MEPSIYLLSMTFAMVHTQGILISSNMGTEMAFAAISYDVQVQVRFDGGCWP
jgi:hypothetical protein